ncbi:MAG TPA: pyridoxamine 5'-phosphate oxidase family protein, partial [Candidatus Saccharimonadia bacterium]|nr:pyridoxamine 5'-phosphate oxidase family protein [Candidatus Saccharimonadia bacterium]
SVLELTIEDISAKIRAHGVKDHADDLSLPYWAGIVPARVAYGEPRPSDGAAAAMPLPSYVAALA